MPKFPIVDAHYDLLMDVTRKRGNGQIKVIKNDYLHEFRESGVNIIVCSLFIDSRYIPEMSLRIALDQISALLSEIKEAPDDLMLCKTYEDVNKAIEEDKIGFILSFEGAEPIGNDLSLLDIFYELGVRMVGLVWSRRNYVGDGSFLEPKEEGTKGGLTDFGIELVKKAESLGMIIDVSHLNDEGFWDLMKISKRPVIASHSNCRELCSHMRNLTDEQMKAIASRGGVIGVNAFSKFVSDIKEEKNYMTLANHVDYIVRTVGIEHVGFGFDFCDFLRGGSDGVLFDVIKSHKEVYKFIEELMSRGYNDEQMALIMGGNFINLYKDVF